RAVPKPPNSNPLAGTIFVSLLIALMVNSAALVSASFTSNRIGPVEAPWTMVWSAIAEMVGGDSIALKFTPLSAPVMTTLWLMGENTTAPLLGVIVRVEGG